MPEKLAELPSAAEGPAQLDALLSPSSFTAALLPRQLLHSTLQRRLGQKLGQGRAIRPNPRLTRGRHSGLMPDHAGQEVRRSGGARQKGRRHEPGGPRARRPRCANDRLWSGLHPDGLAAIYAEHPAAVEAATAHHRSEVLDSPDPLRAVQHVRWSIHKAFTSYQSAVERWRQLAAEIGELAGELMTTSVAAGWSEQDARAANVNKLANTMAGERNEETQM